MTSNPKRVHENTQVLDALELMRKHAIDELPVVDDNNRAVGLIDIQDLIDKGFSTVGRP